MDLGQSLKLAAEAFTRQAGTFFVATLVQMVAFGAVSAVFWLIATPIAPVVGAVTYGLVLGGQARMGLTVISNGATGTADAFDALKRPLDFIVVGLALQAGALLFGVGVLITYALFLFAPILVAEGEDFASALGRSKDLAMDNLGAVLLFVLMIAGINAVVVGATCGFGLAVSLPFTMLATIRVYHQLVGTPPPDVSIAPPRMSTRPSARPSSRP